MVGKEGVMADRLEVDSAVAMGVAWGGGKAAGMAVVLAADWVVGLAVRTVAAAMAVQ